AATLKDRHVAGFYGQTSVWERIKGFGYSYFMHAPDGTKAPFVGAHIVQSVTPQISIKGVSCDVDEIQAADFGGWNGKGLFKLGSSPPPPSPVLRLTTPYTKGPAVLKCQQLLTKHGIHVIEDGIFGPATGAAVRD